MFNSTNHFTIFSYKKKRIPLDPSKIYPSSTVSQKEHIGWLDIGRQEDSRPAIINSERLKNIVSQLDNPKEKYPSVCAYIGGRCKDHILQKLYPWNNIKRHVSSYKVRLRSDVASLGCRQPTLFVDGDIGQNDRKSPLKRLSAGVGHPIFWECGSAQDVLLVLWAQLVFLFTDVICIFLNDFPDHEKILELLTIFSNVRPAHSLLARLLPRLILISEGERDDGRGNTPAFTLHKMLHEPEFASVCGSFAEITTVHLKPTALSDTARCEPLRALVGRELDATRSVREKQRVRPNAEQMADLFQAAFQQLLVNPSTPFDLIWATRAIYTVNPYIKPNVVYYLDACVKAGVRGPHIAPTIASAVLMDNYVPGMLSQIILRCKFPPSGKFNELYCSVGPTYGFSDLVSIGDCRRLPRARRLLARSTV
ncbi:Patatin-like serine hydrolase, putative [Penicillium digitatum PHI26]|uniref:Patatin-like serine hydrolase, putative n=2 Tax=Penicillium digitatum TaxID=36651 RepID=K9G0N6_PEND2|nr:Patatin-like serine hydrolase, putative [Penicillium digitatum Pd1]EKV10551.1 Patatin-like serine hydrolase, putative [Penicillium digitatum Pd1]EKV15540.1 Patatin-like serine hydrolase, putative [Penicillium digitatum PHI26]